MKFFVLSICSLAGLILSGCAASSGYSAEEKLITARGGIGENGVFHDVLYNPNSIVLNFPGYIVGLDKARHHAIKEGATYPAYDTPGTAKDQHGLRDVKFRMSMDPKTHYVSHVVKNHGKAFGAENCLVYTIYTGWGRGESAEEEGKLSGAGEAPGITCPDAKTPFLGAGRTAIRDSPKALDSFRQNLEKEISSKLTADERYTHIVIFSMGWNTPQLEAIQNINALGTHMKAAAGASKYRPLVIGITWPGVWSFEWLDPAIKAISYTAKAHDADEVGTIWMSEVVDAVKAAAPNDVKLVAVGHSFGARAMFSAVCGDSVWRDTRPTTRKIDVLFGWQGAFSVNRFTKEGSRDGFTYKEGCLDRAETIVLTSSKHDSSVGSAFWADMVGSHEQWKAVCAPTDVGVVELYDRPHVGAPRAINLAKSPTTNDAVCFNADDVRAQTIAHLPLRRRAINYLDASNVIIFGHPNTGGGAHSDIYRAVHGRLAWRALVAQD